MGATDVNNITCNCTSVTQMLRHRHDYNSTLLDNLTLMTELISIFDFNDNLCPTAILVYSIVLPSSIHIKMASITKILTN